MPIAEVSPPAANEQVRKRLERQRFKVENSHVAGEGVAVEADHSASICMLDVAVDVHMPVQVKAGHYGVAHPLNALTLRGRYRECIGRKLVGIAGKNRTYLGHCKRRGFVRE